MEVELYKYEIFGLKVVSEIELPCYESNFKYSDVEIHIDSDIEGFDNRYFYVDVQKDVCYLNMPNAGLYKVEKGNKISIFISENADYRAIEMYLLAQCFATILIQRKSYPLHGAVMSKDGISICIVGDPGAGKSTLSTALMLKGWKILTDDLIGINYLDDFPYAPPSYPYQKIWDTTANYFGIDLNDCQRIFNKTDKYYFEKREYFTMDITPLKYIFEIQKSNTPEVVMKQLTKGELLPVLVKNSYRYRIVKESGLLVDHMKYLGELCNHVDGYIIERPEKNFTVNDQVRHIESIVEVK